MVIFQQNSCVILIHYEFRWERGNLSNISNHLPPNDQCAAENSRRDIIRGNELVRMLLLVHIPRMYALFEKKKRVYEVESQISGQRKVQYSFPNNNKTR